MHVEVRAVGEPRAVAGLQRQQGQPVLELLADGGQGVGDDLRGGEQRRAGVEDVAAALDPPCATAGTAPALDHGDLAAGAAEPQCGRETGQPGADDHDAVGATRDGAHGQAVREVAATARAAIAAAPLTADARAALDALAVAATSRTA